MSDFPFGGNASDLRKWLDEEGFEGKFVGWMPASLIALNDPYIFDELQDYSSALRLCELLQTAIVNRIKVVSSGNKTLRDGIPELQQYRTSSKASLLLHILEMRHARCSHNVISEFHLMQLEDSFFSSRNSLWDDADDTSNGKKLKYANETCIVDFVRTFLRGIMNAMKLYYSTGIATDFGIKEISSNIFVISQENRLIGIVSVKMPSVGALNEPVILGELFDHMLLLEGFYCTGPVIGILTTLQEWRFAWFPIDNEHFTQDNWASFPSEGFVTSTNTNATPESPPSHTPSKRGNWAHEIEDEDEDEDETEDSEGGGNGDANQLSEIDRTLNVTNVLNIYQQCGLVLQHICSALKRMSQVQLSYRNGVPQILFQLHKDKYNISYHPISKIPLDMEKLCSSKYPRSDTTSLLAIEDLGRGSSGKAWLACTRTKSPTQTPAICVLKYGNERSFGLQYEKRMWDELYPEFKGKIRLERWSGSDALMMPHFCPINATDREAYRESIQTLLLTRFHQRGYIHRDVAWKNIGFYMTKNGDIVDRVPVLYDLETVRLWNNDEDDPHWVERAMEKLFENMNL